MKALCKEPRDRFQSMDEFRKALVGEVKLASAPARSTAARPASSSATQTLSPKTSTTLSSASSEMDDALTPASGRNWKVMAAIGVAAAVAGVGLLFLPKSHDKPASTPGRAPGARAAAGGASSAGARLWPRRSPCASRPSLRVPTSSTRRTARIRREPRRAAGPQGAEPSAYLFRLAGYREVALSAKPNADRTLHVSLEKLAAPTPTASEANKHHAPAHHGGSGKHRRAPSTKTAWPRRRFESRSRDSGGRSLRRDEATPRTLSGVLVVEARQGFRGRGRRSGKARGGGAG